MPDSPRCLTCLDLGKTGQTYNHRKSGGFKCASCHKTYPKSSFTEADFEWRNKNAKWYEDAKKKLTKVGQGRLDSIRESETK